MSITLTTGTNVSINSVQVENDTIGGCTGFFVDFLGNQVTFNLVTGVILNSNINAGVYGPRVNVTVNLNTGAWAAVNALNQSQVIASGNVSGPALTNFINQVKSDRNLMETFAAGGSGIMPGTQVPW